MIKKQSLLTTGQFAELCNVSKQTLIYYHKIGLFSPYFIDESGYRYYSLRQHETFQIICILKEFHTPLKEIKEYLNNRDREQYLALLEKKNEEMKKKIKRLTRLSNIIQNKCTDLTKGIKVINKGQEVFFETKEEVVLILSKPVLPEDNSMDEHFKYFHELESYVHDIDEGYPVGAILSKENLLKKDFKQLNYFTVRINKSIGDSREYYFPAGCYLSVIHKGSYEETWRGYEKLFAFIEKEGYEFDGDSYEEGLVDFLGEKDEENYFTKISVKVKNKS
ncbi:MerR family transcriptional regulator [Clostridium sediminicola]|uniref:MerR family DNA-binding transcriptional regulator n=1 Tax=Clostridium sediminicola TaxID=3114879 RepID=UPI0031F27227